MNTSPAEKREVRFGIGKLDQTMTKVQAKRWGDCNMPRDLKVVGVQTYVGASDPDLHGGVWYRVDYGKMIVAI